MDLQTLVEGHLIGLLASEDWATRFAAIAEIGRRHAAAAVPALGGCLEDPDPDIRQAAVDALRAINNEDAAALLSNFERIQARLAIDDTVRTVRDPRRKPSARPSDTSRPRRGPKRSLCCRQSFRTGTGRSPVMRFSVCAGTPTP